MTLARPKTILRRSRRRIRCLRKGHAFQRYLGGVEIEYCRRCGQRRTDTEA
jgi:hypothetical protein